VSISIEPLDAAIMAGAVERVRPKMMKGAALRTPRMVPEAHATMT
jgi:Cu/Ag efflux pump CusA